MRRISLTKRAERLLEIHAHLPTDIRTLENRYAERMTHLSHHRLTDVAHIVFGTLFALPQVSALQAEDLTDGAFTTPEVRAKTFNHINIIIMNIKPLADRVLVLPAQAEEKVGGIIIPDTAKEKPQRGKVVATGNGTKDEEMVLKEGDTVLYGKYSGTELEVEGEKYLMMRQSDVLAVVK
ncbi:chaperonin GroS [Hoylesella oralis ATCC 33269]|uniref:Co-chaperonin GroES n=2 Tax=Bacteroidales TaxID=171549 RepID=E7RRP3_9BACT|nr:chaperonin GroS [Hoylesella oralis ATCC 33269]EPH18726.1 chaperonin [Hoylesella oralis HGA0225]SHF76698.1 Co-chaperonin GroES (HSP10) [Hoylesella oralis]